MKKANDRDQEFDVDKLQRLMDLSRSWGCDPEEYDDLVTQERDNKIDLGISITQDKVITSWYDSVIINHDNGYLTYWNIVISILTVLSTFSNLHVAAFCANEHHDISNFLSDRVVFWQTIQEYMFGIDIVIIFFTEYKNMDTGDFEREFSKIALNYLKTTFIIDFLAFFPFFELFKEQMLENDSTQEYDMYHLLFLFRLLRVYKASQLLKPGYVFRAYKRLHKAYIDWSQRKHEKEMLNQPHHDELE